MIKEIFDWLNNTTIPDIFSSKKPTIVMSFYKPPEQITDGTEAVYVVNNLVAVLRDKLEYFRNTLHLNNEKEIVRKLAQIDAIIFALTQIEIYKQKYLDEVNKK